MVVAPTAEWGFRDMELLNVTNRPVVVPANAGTDNHRYWFWRRPSTLEHIRERSSSGSLLPQETAVLSNLAVNIFLHPVGHLNQSPPRPFEK
jgi:hypothetical protein